MPFKLLEIPPCCNFQFGEQLRRHIWLPFLFMLSLQGSHFQNEEHRPSHWFCWRFSFSPDSLCREQNYMKYFLWFIELDLKIKVHICCACSGALYIYERMRWDERLGVACFFFFTFMPNSVLSLRGCQSFVMIVLQTALHCSHFSVLQGNESRLSTTLGLQSCRYFICLVTLDQSHSLTRPLFLSVKCGIISTHLSEWRRRFNRIPRPASPAGGKVVTQGIGLLIPF